MASSDFFNKFGFQIHGAEAVNLARNVVAVVAIRQADVADFGSDLHN